VIDRSICKESLSAIYRATRPRAKRRHGLAFFKLVGACLCGLDHASAVFDGIQTQFTWVITPTLQEHLRSPQKQRWKAKSGLMAACSTQFGLCAYKQNPLHRTSLTRAEFGGFVVTMAIFDLISDDFTYEKRRGGNEAGGSRAT
jgi:hypothetical protein